MPPTPLPSFTGAWPGFTLTGATGTAASEINALFNKQGGDTPTTISYMKPGINNPAISISRTSNKWGIYRGLSLIYQETGSATYPYQATWAPIAGGYGGTLVFTISNFCPEAIQGLAPVTVAATLTTPDGTNSVSLLTAKAGGRVGNVIRYQQVKPTGNNVAASVVVNGFDITVNLATGSGGAITTTGTQRNALIAGNTAAAALITAANASGNDGTGLCLAYGFSTFTGGAGGTPPPPVPMTL